MPLNIRNICIEYIGIKFSRVRDVSEVMFAGLEPLFDELKEKFGEAGDDVEYVSYLEDEAASLNDYKKDLTPLILLMAYACVEPQAFHWFSKISGKPFRKRSDKWDRAMEDMACVGIDIKNINCFDDVNLLRLLVNAYKHANGKADKEELAGILGIEHKSHIPWDTIDYNKLIVSCEKFMTEIANKIN